MTNDKKYFKKNEDESSNLKVTDNNNTNLLLEAATINNGIIYGTCPLAFDGMKIKIKIDKVKNYKVIGSTGSNSFCG